ncbi:MAG: DUF456 domain-containing protein [Deltaproteobacteria bacterium]|nr:DUF456 domain-containing protein [Deltaproteobacteria bacterium]
MSPLEIAGLTIFILVLLLGIFSIIFGFPGTVIIFIDVLIYAIITGFTKIGLKILIILAVLMIIAEVIEFFLGVAGAAKFGASNKGIWASIIGSIIGAMIMTPYLMGLGMIIGAFIGGFFGVLVVELIRQQGMRPAFRAGYGAFLGRVAGIFVKGILSIVMIVITLMNIYS